MKNNPTVFENGTELAKAAAELVINLANKAVQERGRFVVSLSGGHTPETLYSLLAQEDYSERMPWDNIFVFWGDERCVAADDAQNNANMARTKLLNHVAIPATNVFPVPVELQPEEAAKTYEKTMLALFKTHLPRFDLILLGLGENGHTASLFPGTDVLNEKERLVKEVYVAGQKMYRITMTAPLINNAFNILFLVEGEGKATVLNTIINGQPEPEKYPAQLIAPPDGTVYWYVDKAAAKGLQQGN